MMISRISWMEFQWIYIFRVCTNSVTGHGIRNDWVLTKIAEYVFHYLGGVGTANVLKRNFRHLKTNIKDISLRLQEGRQRNKGFLP